MKNHTRTLEDRARHAMVDTKAEVPWTRDSHDLSPFPFTKTKLFKNQWTIQQDAFWNSLKMVPMLMNSTSLIIRLIPSSNDMSNTTTRGAVTLKGLICKWPTSPLPKGISSDGPGKWCLGDWEISQLGLASTDRINEQEIQPGRARHEDPTNTTPHYFTTWMLSPRSVNVDLLQCQSWVQLDQIGRAARYGVLVCRITSAKN